MEGSTNQNFNLLDDASIAAAVETLGVAKTRKMFEEAINKPSLSHPRAVELCLKYAEFEKSLQDLDRARCIYQSASLYSNPQIDLDFWDKWSDFEHHFGCEDTISEMLRSKRCAARSYQHD